MKNDAIKISKYLSYVLRHNPQEIGLTLDTEGWADIAALIDGARRTGQDLDETQIRAVVRDNDKQRFSISEDGKRIRAAQGHTTRAVAINYSALIPPAILFHGTATRFIAAIMQEGLKPGQRQHVHLSDNRTTAESVGQRYGVPVILTVDASRMHEQGFKFYQADNGVWLTDHVPQAFLSRDA
ncbi:RNA 2'-phosphotransferase [Achromobacter seleniivolatilans]|uniref:Probable RNA 2'-phosphotransferase n=1 Tax=Achromobacter seleniivolatilans TaxID=3047478 RepID=A0ABY9LZY1_9BURK|nr:RNA 2'-phosphotransferase [Achromobacter sp. R39]WMD20010.1 RNA 2'-phosphotransferase [Achromobacter sp. R39]